MSATAKYASKFVSSLLAPDVIDSHGIGIPTTGAPKHAITVSGEVTMTVNSDVKTAVAYIDPLSFRAGQLELTIVGLDSTGEPTQAVKGDVGTASSEFSSGAVMSLALGAQNTSGTNENSGTVAVGVLHNTLASATNFDISKLRRQTQSDDFMHIDAKDGKLVAVGISPYLDKGMAHVGTTSSTHQTIVTHSVKGAEKETGVAGAFSAGKGLDTLNGTGLFVESAGVDAGKKWWTSDLAKLSGTNLAMRNSIIDGVHKSLHVTVAIAEKGVGATAYTPSAQDLKIVFADGTSEIVPIIAGGESETTTGAVVSHMTGVADITINKVIKSMEIYSRYPNVAGTGRDLVSFAVSIESTYENSDIPEAPRCMAIFAGIRGGAVLSVTCSALLAVTPADDQLRLMQRPEVDPEVEYPNVTEYVETVLRHVPGAFKEQGREMLLASVLEGMIYTASEQAFSFGDVRKALKPIGRTFKKFARAARDTRVSVSEYAKRIKPILDMAAVGLAAEAPYMAAGAAGGSSLIDAMQRTTLLEGR